MYDERLDALLKRFSLYQPSLFDLAPKESRPIPSGRDGLSNATLSRRWILFVQGGSHECHPCSVVARKGGPNSWKIGDQICARKEGWGYWEIHGLGQCLSLRIVLGSFDKIPQHPSATQIQTGEMTEPAVREIGHACWFEHHERDEIAVPPRILVFRENA